MAARSSRSGHDGTPGHHPQDYSPKSWWLVSIGGAPRWLLMLSGLMLIASGIVIIIGIAGR